MQKLILLSLAVVLLVATSGMTADKVVVVPLNSSQRVYVVGTEIESLPATISSPGFYFITQDLSLAAEGNGINIEADNVTLDLMGFSLVGSGGFSGPPPSRGGIYINDRSNVEIRNGTIKNFKGSGILGMSNGGGHRIINVRAINNSDSGIILHGKACLIERCTATDNGISGVAAGTGSIISDNISHNNGFYGIYGGDGSTLSRNTSHSNNNYGIYTGNGSTVYGNTAYANYLHGAAGIYVGSGSNVYGNTSYDNTGNGINADIGSTVSGNTCYSNSNYGILLEGNNLATQNTAYNNNINMNACATCTMVNNHTP